MTRSQPEGGDPAASTARNSIGSSWRFTLNHNGGVWLLGVLCLLFVVAYGANVDGWPGATTGGLTGIASGAAGALIGLLFGVPRAGKANDGDYVSANTNLEQVSDWLTKIIIGATLTQLTSLRRDFGALCALIAPGLGGGPEAAEVAGAAIVLFFVLGFFIGWFFARLRLGAAMSQADEAIALARRAESVEKSGDPETAQSLRDLANPATPVSDLPFDVDLLGLADQFERIRSSMNPSSRRTRRQDELVATARRAARRSALSKGEVLQLFRSGGEGARIVALAAMQNDPGLLDSESVFDAIANSRSAFEQYHALAALEIGVRALDAADRSRLRNILATTKVQNDISTDSSRADRVDRLQKLLGTEPDASPT